MFIQCFQNTIDRLGELFDFVCHSSHLPLLHYYLSLSLSLLDKGVKMKKAMKSVLFTHPHHANEIQ